MTDPATVASIVSTYEKYGWVLRRLLLTEAAVSSIANDYPGVANSGFGLDAAWFSRPPAPGGISWELRYLGEPPFALLVNADENLPDFEDTLAGVEQRLKDVVLSKKQGLTSGEHDITLKRLT